MTARLGWMERFALRAGRWVVPVAGRSDWTRSWEAELWHAHHPYRLHDDAGGPRLWAGLLLDAAWLRSDAWMRALRGSALLCLVLLSGACLGAMGLGYLLTGSMVGSRMQVVLFAVEAPLVLLVTLATMSRRHIHDGGSLRLGRRVGRQVFYGLKAALVLMLSFLASVDVALPSSRALPLTSDLLQTLLCVVFLIAGLRWAILDQQARCKHCLLTLALPFRIGRPSHNLLEWSGTRQMCRKGHGALSSPEMETCWCSHSRWLDGDTHLLI